MTWVCPVEKIYIMGKVNLLSCMNQASVNVHIAAKDIVYNIVLVLWQTGKYMACMCSVQVSRQVKMLSIARCSALPLDHVAVMTL